MNSITPEGIVAMVQETWREEDGNIFTGIAGNVGIGPGNPDEKLHIESGNLLIERGNLRIAGTESDSGQVITQIRFENIDGDSPQFFAGPKILTRKGGYSAGMGQQSLEIQLRDNSPMFYMKQCQAQIFDRIGVHTRDPQTRFDVDDDFKLGDNGSVMEYFIKETVSHNVPSIPAGTPSIESLMVAGAQTASSVMISPQNALPAGVVIAHARVSATDTVEVTFYNASASAKDPGAMNYFITVAK